MGEMAKKIAKIDVDNLIITLNEAFAEEWLAYYQYWLAAKIAYGPERLQIEEEFNEHAKEELRHAHWIAERIIQLGGTPLLNPEQWNEKAHCKYITPEKFDVVSLLHDNLKAERCAISRYEKICSQTDGMDFETFRMSELILQEEIEHEQELEDFSADIEDATKCLKQYCKI